MSSINLPDSRLSSLASLERASLDPAQGQVALDPRHGADSLGTEALHLPSQTGPAELRDAGEDMLRTTAWTGDAPRQFNDADGIGAQFGTLSLADAAAQAPDAIATILDPVAEAA